MGEIFKIWDENSKERAVELVQSLSIETKWKIDIKKDIPGRSLSQNALMWKWVSDVVGIISDHSGQDKDDIHDFFKQKFLTPKFVHMAGEVVKRYSTKNLKKNEMSEYMEKIYAWASVELGVRLPTPNDLIYGDI